MEKRIVKGGMDRAQYVDYLVRCRDRWAKHAANAAEQLNHDMDDAVRAEMERDRQQLCRKLTSAEWAVVVEGEALRCEQAPRPRDLAPGIYRQRLVVEGKLQSHVTAPLLVGYMRELAGVAGMVPVGEPQASLSAQYGWAGWMHWETSGVHVYAWDAELFFSVDIYSCKPFPVSDVVLHAARTFDVHPQDMVYRWVW